jgi:pimeloyl-ACP methyl ester carboxylesterase
VPFLKYKNFNLYYERSGSGDTALLFIHGLMSNCQTWKYQVEYFADSFEIITIDLFGHGQSDKNVDPVESPRIDAEAVVDLMQTEIDKPYFSIGHSFASQILPEIIKLSLADPNLKGVVFVDCTYQGFDEIIEGRAKFAERVLALSGDAFINEVETWYEGMLNDDVSPDDRQMIMAPLTGDSYRWMLESVAACRDYNNKYPPDETPIWEELPIMILEADNGVGADLKKSWVNHFRKARYFLFENADHFFYITRRAQFNEMLDDFLEGNYQ